MLVKKRKQHGEQVKTVEILILILLFVVCFFMAEFLVDHLVLYSPMQRFLARVGFQIQLYGIVYLLYDSRELSRRLRNIENRFSEESNKDAETH